MDAWHEAVKPALVRAVPSLASSCGCSDVVPLLKRLCANEGEWAVARWAVSLFVDTRPVFLSAVHRDILLLACRELLRDALAYAGLLDGCGKIGVHLWPAEAPSGHVVHLLAAGAAPLPGAGALPAGDDLARVRETASTLEGELARGGGPDVVWRVTLPFPTDAGARSSAGVPALAGECL